ncbi:MAG: V-type ATP synthase subunit A [Myxococcales bacterium]|nr:V-type ATP synthase subunit A [Myxococcales bacterium]
MSEHDSASTERREAKIRTVKESLVILDLAGVPARRNEVGHIVVGEERLRGEVLRIRGDRADMQVFEDTRGVRVGDTVELSGELLSVALGPGLLGRVYDGLQNPLAKLADAHGFFLPRGVELPALDDDSRWVVEPKVQVDQRVVAGQTLATTTEGPVLHRLMVPFGEPQPLEVDWIRGGSYTVSQPYARLRRADGSVLELTLQQRWPVRRPIPRTMQAHGHVERLYPREPLVTTQRIIDTFFPIARGGTACIPGPFGAGKTVLQSLIARYSSVDVVVVIACGERAGEVVETITEYPETKDPRTGGSLMDRTIIICNTSSMPVAAREASIYVGITIGEYYRQMGLDVLCIADSTSRWAQAMRETSGRMEEIPGEEAFPAYLDSTIKAVYERAGLLRTADGTSGSLTMIGTVSPAGGNFEEPVTQATLATVKCFLGLSADRAYRRFYPAIDPLLSWSRYFDQLRPWLEQHVGEGWVDRVIRLDELLRKGESIYQMMQVVGEEGVTLQDFVTWQRATLVDMAFLQQDAFDSVDVSMPIERQRETFELVERIVGTPISRTDRDRIRQLFTDLTGHLKNLNYSPRDSAEYQRYRDEIDRMLADEAAPG